MRPAVDGGSRFAIVLNGSPLFTGGAGSGESEIRRYVLENDLLEAIIAMPTDMFYNTGIATYVWVLSNRKPAHRKGKMQLIDGSSFWQKMRKSLGSKRKEMGETDIATVTRLFGGFTEARLATVLDASGKEVERLVVTEGEAPPAAPEGGKVKLAPLSRIFPNEAFGYRTITVERPLRDETGKVVLGLRGKARGSRRPTAPCATTRMCRSARTSRSISRGRCCRMRRMRGSTMRRRRSAMKSPLTGTFTSSSRRGRWRRSTRS